LTAPRAAEGAELSKFGYDAELRRSLSLGDLLVYGLVFIVPTAPFAIFGIVFNASKGMVALTYVIGLVAMVFTAMSYRVMSEAFPVAGSVYAYAGRGLHPSAGFLAGWAILLDYLLVPTLCYVVGAVAMHAVVPSIPQSLWIIGFLVFNTVINMLGIETTARASKIFLAGELVVLALFVFLGVIAVSRGVNGSHWSLRPFFNPAEFHFNIIFSALSSRCSPSLASTRSLHSPRKQRVARE
jgi:amino acid transporter